MWFLDISVSLPLQLFPFYLYRIVIKLVKYVGVKKKKKVHSMFEKHKTKAWFKHMSIWKSFLTEPPHSPGTFLSKIYMRPKSAQLVDGKRWRIRVGKHSFTIIDRSSERWHTEIGLLSNSVYGLADAEGRGIIQKCIKTKMVMPSPGVLSAESNTWRKINVMRNHIK